MNHCIRVSRTRRRQRRIGHFHAFTMAARLEWARRQFPPANSQMRPHAKAQSPKAGSMQIIGASLPVRLSSGPRACRGGSRFQGGNRLQAGSYTDHLTAFLSMSGGEVHCIDTAKKEGYPDFHIDAAEEKPLGELAAPISSHGRDPMPRHKPTGKMPVPHSRIRANG